jgi:two-component system, NtrC family, response regulator AtoC
MPTLLLIEDEEIFARNVQRYLERHAWDVTVAGSAEEALRRMAEIGADVIVIDFQLPGMDGLAAIATIRERDPEARIIMLTGQGNVQLAVEAMKAGAADFLSKPVALADLKKTIDKLASEGRMRNALAYYRSRDASGLGQIVGESPQIAALKDRIARVMEAEAADTGGPAPSILISGETGSGKELVARACHGESRRRDAAFIEVNCAAIPANLLEAELFGYERGAFTDAKERKTGLIEAADGGTLFLDEIGEADASTQAKLLKVLEDQRIRRLGSVTERRVDVRVITATNRDLEHMVKEGRFRADLLYRLRVITIAVPPLRSRTGDARLLAQAFLGQFAKRYGKAGATFTPAALELLDRHAWPGNVRELRNLVEQSVLLARSTTLDADDLGLALSPLVEERALADAGQSLDLPQIERTAVLQALERTDWNVTQAARVLGISRDTLRYRIDKHSLVRPER